MTVLDVVTLTCGTSRRAVTYLFAAPIGLHEADGWLHTGVSGPGERDGHIWWELRRG